MDAGQLEQAHAAAQAAAAAKFERERFGSQVAGLREALEAALQREYRWGAHCPALYRTVLHCAALCCVAVCCTVGCTASQEWLCCVYLLGRRAAGCLPFG